MATSRPDDSTRAQANEAGTADDFDSYLELSRIHARECATLDALRARAAAGDTPAFAEYIDFDHEGLARLAKHLRDARNRALGQQ